MKYTYIIFALTLLGIFGFKNHGSIYKSNTGNINFFSHTAVEDISADNHKVKTAFDANSGKIQFSALIKDFQFKKALMQEHFNENYMESTKFPKSTFSGTIVNIDAFNIEKNGTYTSPVSGKLTIKDVTKTVEALGTFIVKDGVINAKASFNVNPEDYNISIPKMVSEKISRDLKISVDVDYSHQH
ncbi:MAG: YceI family protein [Bacteroidia bacterium]|nr:YceI family protein [Bacteroidia bacterium]NNJ54556.1 YceI family protein [Bacteroidia bacterium]